MVSGAAGAARAGPSRSEVERLPRRTIHPGSATKAAVFVIADERFFGAPFVIKDVRPMHAWIRTLYGRWVLRREERALRALAGVPGVPGFLGRLDGDALAMRFVAAEPLGGRLAPERLRRACVSLGPRVAALHAAGAVHLDLRQRRNILVDPEGEVWLVDFQSALLLRAGGFWFRLLCHLDEQAVLKFRARYTPDLLTAAERAQARRSRLLGKLWIFHRFGPLLRWLFGGGRARRRPS